MSFAPPNVADDAAAISRESLQQHNRLLYEIASQTGRDVAAQLRHALSRTTGLLALDQGVLARMEEGTYVVEQCYCPDGSLSAGEAFDLEDARCRRILDENGLLAVDHMARSDLKGERCYEIVALDSYIGTPVYCDGVLYGALAFSGAQPRKPSFSEADRSLVGLLGQWVGSILERRAADQALRRSEERFRLLAEHVSDMVCLHDREGRCVYASPSAQRVLGYAPDELAGIAPLELAHPDDAERIHRAALRVLHGEPDVTERVRLRHADGSYRWCETAGHPVYTEDGQMPQHVLTSTRDVTPRVRAEEEHERANVELRRRNRELKDFAHIASHDLQEPLRKIRAFATLMREDYAKEVDDTGQYYLERMEDGAERMARLVSDLLDLSRVTTKGDPFESVDLGEIAATVRTDLEMRIEETEGRVEIGPLPQIEADPTQMRRLLQNLVGNALKFHRAGTPPVVTVRGGCEPAAEHDALETAPEVEKVCRLVVEDNGIGFEEKYLDRIFTPLQRLNQRDAFEGTGIGLAVCRRIAERHGGLIQAESTPGGGSRFIVFLPASQPASGAGKAGEDAAGGGEAVGEETAMRV